MSLKHPHLPTAQRSRCTGIPRARGQGMIEFALLLPLLVLIVFGATDLGRAFQALIAVTNASREGARQGIIDPGNFATIRTTVKDEAASMFVDLDIANDIQITCTGSPCTKGLPLRVQVCYDFKLITRFVYSTPIRICRYTEMMVP